MQQQFSELYFYFKGLLRYKRIAIFITLIFCISAWTVVFFMRDKYESQAKVHIDTATMIRPLMKGMVIEPDVGSMIRIIQQLMFTRPNLEKIIELSLLNPSREVVTNELIDKIRKDIAIKSSGDRDIFDISYSSDDAEVAKSVVQAVLTVFSDQTQGKAMADVSDAHNFIEQQIRDYEIRLQDAEKAKEEFTRNNMDVLVETDQLGELKGIKLQLEDSKVMLEQAQAKKNVLEAQLKEVQDSTSSDWGVSNISQEVSAEEARIQALKDKKTNLLLKYTERHPEIVGIDKLIEDLEKQNERGKKVNSNSSETGVETIGADKLSNPYVQTLKTAYDSAEAEVAADQSLVDSLSEKISNLETGLKDKLTLQTEMKNLNRDYDTLSRQYASLLDRREQAHITERVDDQTSRLKFRVADPPTKATKPSFPNRPLFYSAVLIIGIGLGLGAAFAIYLIRPVYMSHRQVRANTGLPSLGSISLTTIGEANLPKHDWIVLTGFVMVLLGYASVMIYEFLK
jgi:polysaccharide chain length determinant protein (PEP-CTERM system associated)